jgi:peroxiredoxin
MRIPGHDADTARRVPWNALLLILVLVAAAAVTVAMSGWRPGILRAVEPPAQPAPLPPAMAVGHPMPDFALPTLHDCALSFSEVKGQPVVINFFASSCPSCWAEVPRMNAVYAAYRARGLTVLGIGVLDSRHTHAWMVKKLTIIYPTVYDATGETVGAVLGLQAMPTTVLVDRGGIVRVRWQGFLDEETLRREVEKLL